MLSEENHHAWIDFTHTHTCSRTHTHSHLLAAALIYRLFAALFDDFPLAICSISKEKSFKIIYRESREKFLIRSSLSIYRSLLLFLLLLHQTYFRWSVKRKMSEYFTKHSMCVLMLRFIAIFQCTRTSMWPFSVSDGCDFVKIADNCQIKQIAKLQSKHLYVSKSVCEWVKNSFQLCNEFWLNFLQLIDFQTYNIYW